MDNIEELRKAERKMIIARLEAKKREEEFNKLAKKTERSQENADSGETTGYETEEYKSKKKREALETARQRKTRFSEKDLEEHLRRIQIVSKRKVLVGITGSKTRNYSLIQEILYFKLNTEEHTYAGLRFESQLEGTWLCMMEEDKIQELLQIQNNFDHPIRIITWDLDKIERWSSIIMNYASEMIKTGRVKNREALRALKNLRNGLWKRDTALICSAIEGNFHMQVEKNKINNFSYLIFRKEQQNSLKLIKNEIPHNSVVEVYEKAEPFIQKKMDDSQNVIRISISSAKDTIENTKKLQSSGFKKYLSLKSNRTQEKNMDNAQKSTGGDFDIPTKNDNAIPHVQKSINNQSITIPISRIQSKNEINFQTKTENLKDERSFKIINGTKFYKVPKKPKAVKPVRKRRGEPFKKNV